MNVESEQVRAVAAIAGESSELHEVADGTVEDGDGRQWFARPIALPGLVDPGGPTVFAVSQAVMDTAASATWVAGWPGEEFVPLDSAEVVATLLADFPGLPPGTIARVIAATLGPDGAERVLDEAEEVEALFEELAPRISKDQRDLNFEREPGGWRIAFLSARLSRKGEAPEFRVSARRWAVALRDRQLDIATEVLVAGEVLERYRGR